MNIDDLKNEFKNIRMDKMEISFDRLDGLNGFVQKIKKQDRDDEKYILHNKMIPVLAGLFIITIIMLLNPVKNAPMLAGIFLIFSGLFSTLILLFKDYRNISKEPYDLSLFAYLKQKEERLRYWRLTPARYYVTYFVFLSGLILMLGSNTAFIQEVTPEYFIVFLIVYFIILLIFWITGEHFYRKRHEKKHRPLLKEIAAQIEELCESEN